MSDIAELQAKLKAAVKTALWQAEKLEALHKMRRKAYGELVDAYARLKQMDTKAAMNHLETAMREMSCM